ncbi:MAG: RagB/SusD family nutrient uptake outer membrane protein [Prevotella sp.]|jgi:hypothetical protein|nr:RagB/SusD family nutrient uptake outer membrane protein [Prevotella sp.]
MKHINHLIIICIFFSVVACENQFLEKPMGNDLSVDSIFSTEQKALSAIAQAYSMSLASGIAIVDWDGSRTYGLNSGTSSHLSGEINARKFSWEDGWLIQHSGMTADDGSGIPRSDDGFSFNYKAIRQCFLVMENIDKVADMSQTQKEEVKAEMKTLIAYRYEEMFKRYGGIPLVKKSLTVDEDIMIPRSSLEEVLEYVQTICNEAIAVLPDNYDNKYKGRITKGVAMAVKAEILMYAARPLFNSPTPYLSLGEHNNFISFGREDRTLWERAVTASQNVIDWALQHGHQIIKTGSPLDDYGTAVATPNNAEVLIAYKNQHYPGSNGNYYDPHGQSGGANGMSYHMLTQYYKADGTEQTWPGDVDIPYSDYLTKIEEMESRYKASAMGAGIDAWNNPNNEYWSSRRLTDGSNWEGRGGTEACGRRVKFWYHADNRYWFEFPIYRLAEFYLNLAEAYNELNDPQNALLNLKIIRERAGLPEITETNQAQLRAIIQREWAIEFYEECHRFYDVKHWKLPDLGNGIIGGPKKSFIFTYVNGDFGYVSTDYVSYSVQEIYNGFWAQNQYLSPFPIKEVNVGYLIQNPGY